MVELNAAHRPCDALILAGLTLRQLRMVEALADHGQMQRAAAHLGISQPAASKLLSQVETILQAKLFERRTRGLVRTIYGETFVRHIRTLLAEIGVAAEEIADLRSGRGGRVAVGSVMAPAVDTVAAAVCALREEMPRLTIRFDIETSDLLISRLVANELDFVVARIPAETDPAQFDYEEIAPEQASLVVRDGHPLTRSIGWSLAATADYSWIVQHRGSLMRCSVEALLRKHGLAMPSRVVETSSFLATMILLSGSNSIAPIPLPAAHLLMQKGAFKTLALPEPLLVEPYGIIRMRGRPFSPTVLAFYERVKRQFALGSTSLTGSVE